MNFDVSNLILYAFYDFEVSPNSFDFSAFLICAETYRAKHELDSIHLVVVPPATEKGHHDHTLFDDEHAIWRLHNIVLPMTQLLPSCAGFTVCRDRTQAMDVERNIAERIFPEMYSVEAPVSRHHTGWTVIDSHMGADIQYFEATSQARDYARQWIDARAEGRKCVTLTMREAPFLEIRNSDPDVWGDLAQRLVDAGYFPVLLRDIDKALDPPLPQFDGIAEFPEGVFNLGLRMGLYEEAEMNAFVANGPGQVSFYSKNVNFVYAVTGDWLNRNPSPFGRIGINFGETPPMLHTFQRWIWQEQEAGLLFDEIRKLDDDMTAAKADGSYEDSLTPQAENRFGLPELTRRFFEWTNRTYGTIQEQTDLAEACLEMLSDGEAGSNIPEELLERFRLEKLLNAALGNKNLEKAAAVLTVISENYELGHRETVQLGMLHEAMNNWQQAAEQYEHALSLEADTPDIQFRLGVAYRNAGQPEPARTLFASLIESGSNYPELFLELGTLYEELNLVDEAIKCYDVAQQRGAMNAETTKRKLALTLSR